MAKTIRSFMDWLIETDRKKNFMFLNAFNGDEIEMARKVVDFKQSWDVANKYFQQLKPHFACDAYEAEKLIWEANELYEKSLDLEQVVILFTRAIYKAPTNSPQLARAHAHRATVLCKLHYYEAAYDDCTYAFELKHPSTEDVLARQAEIAWQLRDQLKMDESIERFNILDLTVPSHILKFHEQLQALDSPNRGTEEESVLRFPKFNKIKLSKTAERGRFYVAVETIEPGELILEDVAAAFIPKCYDSLHGNYALFNKNHTVFMCDNCVENGIVPFPCYECRSVFYCSKKCREEHKTIHRFECRGYKISLFNYDFACRFGFRCFLLSFDSILHDLQHIEESIIVDTAEELWPMILKTKKEGKLLGLHSDFRRIQRYKSGTPYGLYAFLLTFYLSDQTDFFEQTRAGRLALMSSDAEWHIIVTGLILHFTFILVTNALSCNACQPRIPFAERKIDLLYLSTVLTSKAPITAVYCWFSFFNHSCHSNSFLLNDNLNLKIYSRRRIIKNEEVTVDYLHNSTLLNKAERQAMLRQYLDCRCGRCLSEDDPIYAQSVGIPCECGGTCFLFDLNPVCKKCGNRSWQKYFFDSISRQQQSKHYPESFVYIYGMWAILKKSLKDSAFGIFSEIGESILKKFLSTKSEEVLGDEQINRFMLKLAVDLVEITKNKYFPPLQRAIYAIMLIDLLSICKARGFNELTFKHVDLIKDVIWPITGKPRKIIDAAFESKCF